MTRVRARRLVTRQQVYEPGLLVVEQERVVSAGPWDGQPVDVETGTLVPGLVDVHGHGGGGASYAHDPQTAVAAHRGAGSTTLVASTVTETLDDLEQQIGLLAPLVRSGELAGIHLEGPWLAEEFHGAHPVPLLRDPLAADVARMLDAGAGTVRMVTLAPERTGGLDAVRQLAEAGVVAAVGHTSADYGTTQAAVAAGATGATHLFNAMRPIHHRSPGPSLALMSEPSVWLELVVDGVHLHPEIVRYVATTYPERVVLVTDAMAAAGAADGDYLLGTLAVTVRDQVARIAGTDTIAGSTLTLARALRNAITYGVSWLTAVAAATWQPAAYLGLSEVGDLAPGFWADAVELSEDWTVSRVLYRGSWL